jgi:hypothetical protein
LVIAPKGSSVKMSYTRPVSAPCAAWRRFGLPWRCGRSRISCLHIGTIKRDAASPDFIGCGFRPENFLKQSLSFDGCYDQGMLVTILAVTALLLHLAIAVILVRKFIQTRGIGFIWLGAAVVAWPLLSKLLDAGERVLIDRRPRTDSTTNSRPRQVGKSGIASRNSRGKKIVFRRSRRRDAGMLLSGICARMNPLYGLGNDRSLTVTAR